MRIALLLVLLTCASEAAAQSAAARNGPAATARRDSLIWRRDELLARFVFSEDRIEGGGFYRHVDQTVASSYDRNYLDVPVSATGRTYLRTHYAGDWWLFHDRVIVRIGDRVLRSGVVDFTSVESDREAGSGGVWESLHFLRTTDGGIPRAIASTTPDENVIVRYQSSEGEQKTFDLMERDRRAIAEAMELATLIRSVGRTTKPSRDKPVWIAYHPASRFFLATERCHLPIGESSRDWRRVPDEASARTHYQRGSEEECAEMMKRPSLASLARAASKARADSLAAATVAREAEEAAALREAENRRQAEAARADSTVAVNAINSDFIISWVRANPRTKTFFKLNCKDDQRLRNNARITFSSWQGAVRDGYRRSRTPGC